METSSALRIDVDSLAECGSPKDPGSRLVGLMTMNGAFLEVTAYAVGDDATQEAADPFFRCDLRALRRAFAPGGARFGTVRLNGRRYALFVLPVVEAISPGTPRVAATRSGTR